jgi:low affinity Fe/Cu permease
MDIKDLIKNSQNLTSSQIENRLNEIVRTNHHFSNLDEKNKQLVLDLIIDYKNDIRHGIAINSHKIQRDVHSLYEKRFDLGLTSTDLENIKEILSAFKS